MQKRFFLRAFICALTGLVLCAGMFSPLPQACPPAMAIQQPARPDVTALSAIVMDADSGKVLFEKDADTRRAMASTTKLMTLLLALDGTDPNKMVVIPDCASDVPADSTRVPVYPGEKMPFEDLLYGLMIKSGNDAANAVASICAGSVSGFVEKMNDAAKEMGLSNTHFANPHGYPASGHYSTARDMAAITRKGLNQASFRRILTTRSHEMSGTSLRDAYTLSNTYAILNPDSPYYYRYAVGGKTGYSSSSGQCFVCVAEKNGRTLISVVLNAGGSKPPKWQDTAKLMDYGFSVLEA